MKTDDSSQWKTALNVYLDSTFQSLQKKKIDWAIIGSVALYLQGCNIIPKDIDILVKDPKSVYSFNVLHDFQKTSSIDSFLQESEEELWFSTKEKPVDESVDQWRFK